MRYFIIATLSFLIASCYQPEDQYTTLADATLHFESSNNILADSFSVYKVTVSVPGLLYQDSLPITLTTTWGNWPNGKDTFNLNTFYAAEVGGYKAVAMLKSARTVSPFTISLSTRTGIYKSYEFASIANLPDQIQILSDSLSLKLKPGSYTHLIARVYASKGYPSYGFRFRFLANNGLTITPLLEDFGQTGALRARMIITHDTQPGEVLVSGEILGSQSPGPLVIPVKIKIQ